MGFIGLPAAGIHSPTAGSATVTATATVTTTAPAPSVAASGAGPSASNGSPSVRWSGPLLISGDFDLDSVPPHVPLPTEGDIILNQIKDGHEAEFTGRAGMAVVPEGESPDPAECILLVQTQPQAHIAVPAGRRLCLITNEGRPALVTATALHPDAGTVGLNVLVWEQA
ncbi:hypothetical protein [Streptomyces sp. NPDC058466]|uniref:hypothetical protein n=1 Tax=unclassified Streptomyces TaxID=2593676 RepID=UPI003651408E